MRLLLRLVGVFSVLVLAWAGLAYRPPERPPQTEAASPLATTTSTTSTTTTPTTTTPTLPTLTLGAVGDTSFTHGLHARDPLGEVADLLGGFNLMALNLETAVAEPGVGVPFDKEFTFLSPPESARLLADAGVDVVSLANNHGLDFGRPALVRSLELLEEAGLTVVGAGRNLEGAYGPGVLEAAGRTIAFLGFSRVLSDAGWVAGEDRPGVASAYDPWVERTEAAVAEAARTVDLVVVLVHWGLERHACPHASQRELAQRWAEAGADLVVGSHPHVLQGVTRIGETWVLYSTGNFSFPSARGAMARSAIFEVVYGPEGRVGLRAHPIRIVAGRPVPTDDPGTLEELSDRSFGWRFDQLGVAHPAGEPGSC